MLFRITWSRKLFNIKTDLSFLFIKILSGFTKVSSVTNFWLFNRDTKDAWIC